MKDKTTYPFTMHKFMYALEVGEMFLPKSADVSYIL